MMDRSRDSRKRFLEALLAGGVLLVVFFLATPAAPYLRGMFASLLASRATNQEFNALSHDVLIARIMTDEQELSRIKYQAVLYSSLADENAKLLKILHGAPHTNTILAQVVSRPPHVLYDTLLINQGSDAGIAEGNVVVFQGIALGKVISAGKNTALVQLFSSPGTKEDVRIGIPGSIAVLDGLGGGAFELSVPQGVSVSKGDAVRFEGNPPLLMGTVMSVFSNPSDSSQTVSVRSPISFADLDFVEVIPSLH